MPSPLALSSNHSALLHRHVEMTSIFRLPACRPEPVYVLVCEVMRRGRGARAAESINIPLSGRLQPFCALLPRINNRVNGKILQGREDFRRKIVKNLRTAPRGLDICAPP